jgi:multisubunit Na+/H+ antiporter MnhB subunit
MIYGHDRPGDGFTAGVLVSLAIAFWYVVFGYEEIRARLFWLRPRLLLAGGLLLALVTGLLAAFPDGAFLGPADWGKAWGLPLPPGFYLSRAFLFEVAIGLTVLGSAAYILNVLGHPGRVTAPTAETSAAAGADVVEGQ